MGNTRGMVEDGAGTPATYPLRPAAPANAGGSTTSGPGSTADATVPTTAPGDTGSTADATPPVPPTDAPRPGRPAAAPAPPTDAPRPGRPAAAPAPPTDAPPSVGDSSAAVVGRHRRENAPFAGGRVGRFHPRRLRPTRQGVRRVVHSAQAWSRRPAGRLIVPGVLMLSLIAGTGTAGAVLVPATAGSPVPTAAPTTAVPRPTAVPQPPTGTDPDLVDPFDGEPNGLPDDGLDPGDQRPASVLAGWAAQTGGRLGIPPVAMEAYGYAELVLANTSPNCRLTWTTVAAIGMIESTHGTANGSRLDTSGRANPPIVGLPLDGAGGRQRIADTDRGTLDNDLAYDRAVGPMQFIPTTWEEFAVDADNDGVADPQDIDDASLAAANYLCRNGRDLSTAEDWWSAILSYNNVQPYAQAVFDTANEYGVLSRT
ncbi:lytic murein transglycosylase [Solwaraspora sp. WMMD406]|uniref:lytic transglycosylase domain-containing protein n=1 Tax=Solwaraspora sp. WMMD406 TaxID=3016095 RepID=UPI00241665EB|nr:lytic murein transglycosylase [Solwaraspora sp. WMMD406]MDG4768153.1 lytic murein transglycosylase [Solwaraspora sp. WMMD406]